MKNIILIEGIFLINNILKKPFLKIQLFYKSVNKLKNPEKYSHFKQN